MLRVVCLILRVCLEFEVLVLWFKSCFRLSVFSLKCVELWVCGVSEVRYQSDPKIVSDSEFRVLILRPRVWSGMQSPALSLWLDPYRSSSAASDWLFITNVSRCCCRSDLYAIRAGRRRRRHRARTDFPSVCSHTFFRDSELFRVIFGAVTQQLNFRGNWTIISLQTWSRSRFSATYRCDITQDSGFQRQKPTNPLVSTETQRLVLVRLHLNLRKNHRCGSLWTGLNL